MNTNEIETILAQLRHLYVNMNESCKDSVQAKNLAHGILGPVIEKIEKSVQVTTVFKEIK